MTDKEEPADLDGDLVDGDDEPDPEALAEQAQALADEDLEDEDDEEGEDEGGDRELGGDGAPQAARTAKDQDAPGPDVPAPPLSELRAALEWAFANEGVSPELLDRYARHARMLLDHNRQVNLTAILDPREVAAKHYLDSWRLTQLLSFMGKRVVDLGSGGGFPGLPLAMVEPHASVVLVESSQKKAAFLQHCVDELEVANCTVFAGRCEDYLIQERCDLVLVRAVSSVRENVRTLRKVRHSLKDMLMLKGASWSREVRAGEREVERLGFHLDTVWEHDLPEEMGHRAILIYRAPGGQGL